MRLDFHLGEELDRPILLLVQFQDPVYDWDVSPVNLEHNNLPNPDVLLLIVGQKEQVAPLRKTCVKRTKPFEEPDLECRLHAARQDDDDGRLRAGDDHQPLPDHQSRGDDHTKRQHLEFSRL